MDVNVAPTKANLMSAKSTLEVSKKGYELLDQKRNVLIREMMGLVDSAKEIQSKINSTFEEAYEALKMANITMGVAAVEAISHSVSTDDEVEILFKSVMGVEIPKIKYEKQEALPVYSFYQTNASMDVAFKKFHEIKYLVLQLAEVENSVYKLAIEIKKTQKRANALDNIQIPKYTEIVKFIQDSLDEKDREDFFRLKVVKKKRIKKKAAV
ncbi:MAG TPA: V-type ATP synthase subunit D [Clostridiaceae bacterium]|nr:V-type ATP synthase subunit D [Clostridiaceae bacterium]HBF78180.1 V-type ATP synthase subunit D [Clostridiaceae bacterium]HBG37737.1 V-type ATP synthase subunit D [Clostridiaceae bacterium]HBN29308.1 V-type ATP synthase subunit D [Clostridiaceae bacterium]HBX48088.1 V-type ATP synthase subunit D [Clostridiaceae bacterium]